MPGVRARRAAGAARDCPAPAARPALGSRNVGVNAVCAGPAPGNASPAPHSDTMRRRNLLGGYQDGVWPVRTMAPAKSRIGATRRRCHMQRVQQHQFVDLAKQRSPAKTKQTAVDRRGFSWQSPPGSQLPPAWLRPPSRATSRPAPNLYAIPTPTSWCSTRASKSKLGNTPIQRLYTGTLWAEGPAWNGVGRYLVWSDIPQRRASCAGSTRMATSGAFAIRPATATATPSTFRDGRSPASTATRGSSATSTTAR